MQHSPNPLKSTLKPSLLGALVLVSICFCAALIGPESFAQQSPTQLVRVPITATGQSAIGRVRGRLQISYDELNVSWGSPIYLRLIRDQKRLEVWVKGRRAEFVRLRSYRICGTSAPLGPRSLQPVLQQPEGFYVLGISSLRPQAVSYLGLDIGWPNALDRANGLRGSTSLLQAGCSSAPHFGLTDQDMEEVYTLVYGALSRGQRGVALHIFPFDMNTLGMLTKVRGPNAPYWRSLEPAWSAFERTKKPPQVSVSGRQYIVVAG